IIGGKIFVAQKYTDSIDDIAKKAAKNIQEISKETQKMAKEQINALKYLEKIRKTDGEENILINNDIMSGHKRNTNVKIASSHAGITLGEDGATHQTMEDIALMRALPGMAVVVPCDYNQTKNATIAAALYDGPVYLRFGRPSIPNFTPENEKFEIGKVYVLNEGSDVTILACGYMVWEALQAAERLEEQGIRAEVVNVATIKPLEEDAIVGSLQKTGCAVVAEEHNMAGGLGEAVSGVLARRLPSPVEFVNGGDRFGQSGTPSQLMAAYGLNADAIVEKVNKVISRK
ncbi:MAG TPA: hypothetical protein DHU75_04665, partial [Rikenellaceae bacterium]|nr:hypothetical protein [Rikenellaceae bacterium]